MNVELFHRLRQTLRRSDAFDDDATLLAIFESDPRLQTWQDLVPDALNRARRVQLTIAALQGRYDNEGRPALVLLLHVLRDLLDPADRLHSELDSLAQELAQALGPPTTEEALEPPADAAPAPGPSPFKGLYYYDVADADNFFGREQLTARLLNLLQPDSETQPPRASFIAVIGPSGSGKTSLLRAGLLAALQDPDHVGLPPGVQGWPNFLVTPGTHPLRQLAVALTRDAASVRAAASLEDDMNTEPRSLTLYIHRLLQENGQRGRVLLVVDQLEELYHAGIEDDVRQIYLDNLVTACSEGPLCLVVALRSDFYDAAGGHAGLRTLLAQNQLYIGPMSEAELKRAVTVPALQYGWRFEPGLVDRILSDAGRDPSALPLLSQALHATWERRRGRTLTHDGYREAGGVAGAIARAAENAFTSLSAREQDAARSLLLRMVIPAPKSGERLRPDMRAPVTRAELLGNGGHDAALEQALRTLQGAHLIAEGNGVITLAHEALISRWPRLRGWLDDERQRLSLHRRLTDDAREWDELDQHPDATYRGEQLQMAERYAAQPVIPLTSLERLFLEESRREETRRAAEQARRLQAARRGPLGGAIGGAAGYALTFWLMYRSLISFTGLLVAFTIFQTVLGAAAGAGLVWGMNIIRSPAENSDGAPRSWRSLLTSAGSGALVFALLLLAHAMLTQNEVLFAGLLSAAFEGALWGAAVGAGLAWVRQTKQPAWLALALVALLSGAVLLVADLLGGAFSWEGQRASLPTVFLTGALTPLAILLGSELLQNSIMQLARGKQVEIY